MKRVVLVLHLFILVANAFSQSDILQKEWIGLNLEYLSIEKTELIFEKPGFLAERKTYSLLGDTLRIFYVKPQQNNNPNSKIKYYDFLIKGLTDSVLILVPNNNFAKALVDYKDSIVYKERHFARIAVNDFEYIRFNSTTCKGDCVAQAFEITSNRKMRFIGGANAKKKGFYIGDVCDSLFFSLIEEIEMSNFTRLNSWKQQVNDIPEISIEIKYGDTIKSLKYFIFPSVAYGLVEFLYNIPEKAKLIESKEPFVIAFGK